MTSIKHAASLPFKMFTLRSPITKVIEKRSACERSNINSIELQQFCLYLTFGLYKQVSNHFSLRIITSKINASIGVITIFSKSVRRLCGRSLLTCAIIPPPCMFLSARWHLKPVTWNWGNGKDPSNLVSERNKTSIKFSVRRSEISKNLFLTLFIFRWPVIRFFGCDALKAFSDPVKFRSSFWLMFSWHGVSISKFARCCACDFFEMGLLHLTVVITGTRAS